MKITPCCTPNKLHVQIITAKIRWNVNPNCNKTTSLSKVKKNSQQVSTQIKYLNDTQYNAVAKYSLPFREWINQTSASRKAHKSTLQITFYQSI